MKIRTSLAFDAMTGTAGEVTARSTRFGTILSGRARQPGRVTPQQKDMRALFARVGLDLLKLPLTAIPSIPAVEYHNIIVTPGLIQFSRLQNLPQWLQMI